MASRQKVPLEASVLQDLTALVPCFFQPRAGLPALLASLKLSAVCSLPGFDARRLKERQKIDDGNGRLSVSGTRRRRWASAQSCGMYGTGLREPDDCESCAKARHPPFVATITVAGRDGGEYLFRPPDGGVVMVEPTVTATVDRFDWHGSVVWTR